MAFALLPSEDLHEYKSLNLVFSCYLEQARLWARKGTPLKHISQLLGMVSHELPDNGPKESCFVVQ